MTHSPARLCSRIGSWLLIVYCLTTGISQAQSPDAHPDRMFREGVKKYGKNDFQAGLDQFNAAREMLPDPAPWDPALIHYNRGIGFYRMSQPEEAVKAFQQALQTTDLSLQRRAYFNLGNALYQFAQQKLNEGEITDAFRSFQQASTNYMQTLRLESRDLDAKVNYELSVQAQWRILQMVAMAMERMQQGEQLVGQYRFVEAAQWFQQNQPLVEKALAMQPEAQTLFKTMTERTSAVAEIITNPEPGVAP